MEDDMRREKRKTGTPIEMTAFKKNIDTVLMTTTSIALMALTSVLEATSDAVVDKAAKIVVDEGLVDAAAGACVPGDVRDRLDPFDGLTKLWEGITKA
jgi:hypothetical protein